MHKISPLLSKSVQNLKFPSQSDPYISASHLDPSVGQEKMCNGAVPSYIQPTLIIIMYLCWLPCVICNLFCCVICIWIASKLDSFLHLFCSRLVSVFGKQGTLKLRLIQSVRHEADLFLVEVS